MKTRGRTLLRQWIGNDKGSIALIFAVCLIAIAGSAGVAVDYLRLSDTRTRLQANADADALASRNGNWVNDDEYKVNLEENVPLTIMRVLGLDFTRVAVTATAQFGPALVRYETPADIWMDVDTIHVNQLGVYCYDPATGIRTPLTAIADNKNGHYDYTMPSCTDKQEIGFAVSSYINMAQTPERIHEPGTKCSVFYGDAAGEGLKAQTQRAICTSPEGCNRTRPGAGRNHTTIIAPGTGSGQSYSQSQKCEPGKLIDFTLNTPIGNPDKDEARVIYQCPSASEQHFRTATLIK
jgi:hypothetical protein